MLTIRAARNPGYYETPEFARDDYYTEHGDVPGEWIGSGAGTLGLEGAPHRGELEQLLEGQNPATGERLAGLREGRRNAGFDLTWTAPKSVSVLHAIGDDRLRAEVRAAHEAGVRAGLDYLEAHECQARRGAGGHRIVEAQGFVGAVFTHEMSRAGDPHLHTHLVVANAVEGPDGRWSAQDMRPVYQAAKTAGTIAEAVMRRELTRLVGVAWGPTVNGTAEIQGVPREVIQEFSRRRAEILELAGARGIDSLQGVSALQRETRDRKPALDREVAVGHWRARAAEHGLGIHETTQVLYRAHPREATPGEIAQLAERLAGPEGLTQKDSTFDRRAVLRAFAEAHAQGTTRDRIESLADDWIRTSAIPIQAEVLEAGQRPTWSTPDMLETERRLLNTAMRKADGVNVAPGVVETVLARHPEAGADQAQALRHLTTGHDSVRVMVARAGTGKTYTLGLTREALDAAGIPITGCAWQGKAAQVLETDAQIPSVTIASLLARIERQPETALPRGGVLIIDEAGTVPTRPLTQLLEYAAQRDTTVLLVGDPRQLPSIDAGGALGSLAKRLGSVELTENRRQRTELQQQIAAHLAAGQPDRAIALLTDHQRLTVHQTPEQAREALIKDWARDNLQDPSRALILAHDRADVVELNRLARQQMEQAGLLGPERLVAHGREWAEGDRLVCRKNDYRPDLDVRNGTMGQVTAIDTAQRSLTIKTDDGRAVRLPADYLDHAHHAYAITAHISQGATTNRTYLLAAPDRGGKEWGYVAGSRHRIDLHVHTHHNDPDGAARVIARAWGRTRAKTLAVDTITPDLEIRKQEFRIGPSERSRRDAPERDARATNHRRREGSGRGRDLGL